MMAKTKRKFILYFFIVIVIVGIIYIFFNERGAIKYPSKMEQIAREKYNMKRENEVKIDVEEK
ncbi:MAG: hypothetical protein P8X47_00570 [Ignavibacteriaceae bacterium]